MNRRTFLMALPGMRFGAVKQPAANGFILRGTLTSSSSDGTNYFNVGEAIVMMLPKDSALAAPLRALDGKKVVISVVDDGR